LKFALDTNTISYAMRGEGAVRSNISSHPVRDIGIPAICVYESLRGGLTRGFGRKRFRELENFLASFAIIPFEWRAADHASRIAADLARVGLSIGGSDILIAGTARANALTLVTRNISEFSRAPGLTVVNWY